MLENGFEEMGYDLLSLNDVVFGGDDHLIAACSSSCKPGCSPGCSPGGVNGSNTR